MSRKTLHISELGEAFAEEFGRVLTIHKLSVAEAARALGISRQAFHNYLTGKSVPRRKVQAKAAELWSIGVRMREVEFDSSAFGKARPSQPLAQQMEFFFAKLDSIQDNDVRTEVKRIGSTLNVAVRIEIPA